MTCVVLLFSDKTREMSEVHDIPWTRVLPATSGRQVSSRRRLSGQGEVLSTSPLWRSRVRGSRGNRYGRKPTIDSVYAFNVDKERVIIQLL